MAETKIDVDESGATTVYTPKPDFKVIPSKKPEKIATAETGGYTGAWGPEGKLAVLHEKEIVLNKEDTANLLNTVRLVDNIIKSIDASSFAALNRSIMSLPTISSTGDTLQQEITIHADFPNATNHSEIEEALQSLVNKASQYANRKR
jgi:hypothetical protein